MNKRISFLLFFIALFSGTSFAQDWSVYYTPRFRHLKDIHVINPDKIAVVGGNPFNDSITYMATTNNAGVDWTFHDFFPGKQINTLLFKNNNFAICAGDNQALYKTNNTGETWQLSSWGISLNNRNINKLFNGQYDVIYAAGGLDSVNGFLLKSIDGGIVWENINEWPNNEIKTAFSPKHNQIIVAGYAGFMQLSNDGGDTWTNCEIGEIGYLPEITSFDFIDEDIGFACGGKRGIDSTCLILKTINGGNSWSISYNTAAPCLNNISMASNQIIYAVGEYGKVIKSVDAGETWEDEIIEGNPEVNFYSVEFLNSHIGAISGEWGYVMIFDDGETNLPEIQTKEATNIQNESAILNAIVNPGFMEAQMYFVYGIDENFDTEVSVGNYTGGEMQNISITVQELQPNKQYYYYAKIISFYGEYHGEIKSFYTGNPIPNWDFEEWNEFNGTFPSDWFSLGSVEKILSGDDAAVRVFTNQQLNMNGAVVNGNIVADLVQNQPVVYEAIGGHPFNFKAQEFSCKLKYNIYEGDSAFLALVLKKQGNIISSNFYFLVGNTNYNIVDTTFGIEYDIDIIPDTVIFGFTNTAFNFDNPVGQSFVEMYNVWFENTNENCLNHDFEQWFDFSYEYPVGWGFEEFDGMHNWVEQTYPFFKTEDAFHNNFALCLQLNETSDEPAIYTQANTRWIPVTERHDFLEAYIKYLPDGIDTAHINIEFKTGINQYYGGHIDIVDEINDWTKISIPLYYENDTIIPDSVSIFITSTRYENPKYSQLCIDKICFDGDYIPVEEEFASNLRLYPNPTNDIINISNLNDYNSECRIKIIDLLGKIHYNCIIDAKSDILIDVASLERGIYIVLLEYKKSTVSKKFIKI